MGYDSACTLTIDGRAFRGTAVLEHKELLFRGDVRLVIPLNGIDEARADGDALIIVFGGRSAAFAIGADAAGKWD